VPRYVTQAVEDAVLFEEYIYTLALSATQRGRHGWSDMHFVRDGALRKFAGEEEWLR
jgi:hypothetical protein